MYETETLKEKRAESKKRSAAALLVRSESAGCAVELLLGSATSCPTRDILRTLAEATDILMHQYDYDGDGWERLHYAMENAIVRADEIDEAMKILHNRGIDGKSPPMTALTEGEGMMDVDAIMEIIQSTTDKVVFDGDGDDYTYHDYAEIKRRLIELDQAERHTN